jgi:hypothetical protein
MEAFDRGGDTGRLTMCSGNPIIAFAARSGVVSVSRFILIVHRQTGCAFDPTGSMDRPMGNPVYTYQDFATFEFRRGIH